MKSKVSAITRTLLLMTGQTVAQVSWQFTDGPYYATIDDFSVGESGGQVVLYAASPVDEAVYGIVLKSTDGGESWMHRDIPEATGKVACVATFRSNPSIVYAGVSSQGVYKSTNGGDTWALTGPLLNTNVSRIALHPTNSNIVWAGCLKSTTPVLYSSADGGASWAQKVIGGNQLSVSDIAVTENTNYVWVATYNGTGTNEGVWQTVNGGDAWDRRIEGMDINNLDLASLAVDPNNPDILFLGNRAKLTEQRRIYKTTTGTTTCTWESKYTAGAGSWWFSDLRVRPGGLVYASTGSTGDALGVLKSTDGGGTWSVLATGILFKDLSAIEVDPLSSSIVFVGGNRAHYKSSDAGQNWHERTEGMFITNVGDVKSNNGRLFTIGKPRYVFRRESGSTNWNGIFDPIEDNYGIENMALAMDPASTDKALFGWEGKVGDDLHIWRTTDGGLIWNQTVLVGPKLLTAMSYKGSQYVYATVVYSAATPTSAWVYQSIDAGVNWNIRHTVTGTGAELRSVATGGNSIYAGGKASTTSGSTVYRSTDEGSSWTNTSGGLPGTAGSLVRSLSVDQSNESIVYAATTEGVYKTTTGGSLWAYKSPSAVTFKSLVIHPTNTSVVYAVTDDPVTPRFYRSTNAGEVWTEINTGLPSARVHTLDIDPVYQNTVYAATEVGVYSITHVWTGSINVSTTWKTGQTYLVEGVLAVSAGKTLIVESGARVEFMSGARLDVKGELLASGTSSQNSVFTRNGSTGSWTGIVVENSSPAPKATLTYARIEHCATAVRVGSNTTFSMNNCTVDNAGTGLEFTNFGGGASTATVTNSQFTNIAITGILITSFSNLTINGNNITQATLALPPTSGIRCFSSSPRILDTKVTGFTRGVQCLNSSSPIFENGGTGGYNNVSSNGTGVYIKSNSNPVLGSTSDIDPDEGGQNCVYGNTGFEVVLLENSHALAENNYWGTPFDPHEFSIESGSSIDYNPYLSSCPPGAMNVAGGGNPHLSPSFSLLREAINEYSDGKYDEATLLFEAAISDTSIPQVAKEWGVTQLLACAQNLRSSDFSSYLEALRRSSPELTRTIDFVLPHAYLDESNVVSAMEAFDSNIAQYPGTELERDGLYGRFLNALYTNDDTSEARILLGLLQTEYPESDEAFVASVQLQNIAPMGLLRVEVPSSELTTRGSQVPSVFRLSQNYPNPFNPTTTIKYDLPVDALVSLSVYDVLGREVMSLVEGSQVAGYHQVILDASRLASGLYFYQLKAGEFSDVRKLVVVK